jgi:hypothetical protein
MGRGRRDGLGVVGRRLGVAMRTYLALGLVLVVLTSPARGQSWDRWFRVSWGPEANAKTPTARIEASVHNDSPYRVTDVELEVEGLRHCSMRGAARAARDSRVRASATQDRAAP